MSEQNSFVKYLVFGLIALAVFYLARCTKDKLFDTRKIEVFFPGVSDIGNLESVNKQFVFNKDVIDLLTPFDNSTMDSMIGFDIVEFNLSNNPFFGSAICQKSFNLSNELNINTDSYNGYLTAFDNYFRFDSEKRFDEWKDHWSLNVKSEIDEFPSLGANQFVVLKSNVMSDTKVPNEESQYFEDISSAKNAIQSYLKQGGKNVKLYLNYYRQRNGADTPPPPPPPPPPPTPPPTPQPTPQPTPPPTSKQVEYRLVKPQYSRDKEKFIWNINKTVNGELNYGTNGPDDLVTVVTVVPVGANTRRQFTLTSDMRQFPDYTKSSTDWVFLKQFGSVEIIFSFFSESAHINETINCGKWSFVCTPDGFCKLLPPPNKLN